MVVLNASSKINSSIAFAVATASLGGTTSPVTPLATTSGSPPTFETITGSSEGPTRVMRHEHDQVRGLLGKMAEAVENEDSDAYLSMAESMMILLQQHNMKEEQMLYAMCDRVIPQDQKEATLETMKSIEL